MKRWNRLLAVLLIALMLCGMSSAVAEAEPEPEVSPEIEQPQADPEGIELEIELEDADAIPDESLDLPDDLLMEELDSIELVPELAPADSPSNEANDYDNEGENEYDDSDFDIRDGVLYKYNGINSDIIIPDGVTRIGDSAFRDCFITSVTIPNSVTNIGNYAFYDCHDLRSVTIPNSVTNIGDYAFHECIDLQSITLPNSVTSIGTCAFRYCYELSSAIIPNSVTFIGDYAFCLCKNLTSIIIPDSVTNIGAGVFQYCHKLTDITIPNSVTSIGEDAFSWCTRLTSVTIPNSVTIIGRYAFAYCTKLNNITIPNSVSSIQSCSFYKCENLKDVTILSNEISITAAFDYDANITFHIICTSNAVEWAANEGDYDDDDKWVPYYIVLLIHGTEVTDPEIPATYTREGREAGSHCSACGTILSGCQTIPKKVLPKNALLVTKTRTQNIAKGDKRKIVLNTGTAESYKSSNSKVVSVSDKGILNPIKLGSAKITITTTDGIQYILTLKVIDGVALSEKKLTLPLKSSKKLTVKFLDGRTVTWSSSNTNIATVKNGKVTAVKVGTCYIYAKIQNGKKLSCKVTVIDPAELSQTALDLTAPDSSNLTLTGRQNRSVTWSTSNSNVVKITKSDNNSATIKSVKAGTATITAKIENGKTLRCKVKVINPLTIKEGWEDYLDELYPWEVGVKFINNSNRIITYVTFEILQYNNRGDKLESPYDYYYYNDNINPHDYEYNNYTVNDDTRSVKFKIREVTFANNVKWKP